MKYQLWLSQWLKMLSIRVKEQTLKKYASIIKLHVVNKLGNYKLKELSAKVLEEYSIKLAKSNLSPNSINGIITLVSRSLKCAVLHGKVGFWHSNALIKPKIKEKIVECFSISDQKKIENHIIKTSKQNLYGILLTLYTGLRIGELLALTWQDVDFVNGAITISKSCHDKWQNGKYKKFIDTPKTEKSTRIIPLPKQILSILKLLKKQSNSPFVVSGRTSEGAQIGGYQIIFKNLLKHLSIAHKGFHALRHTFATRCIECGMDIKTLSEILGHASTTTTLNRYAHSFYEHKKLMMNKLGKLLECAKKH